MSFSIVSIIKDVKLPDYYYEGKFKMTTFKEFPFVSYTNGLPCIPINLYLQSSDNLKLNYKSIKQKAHNLSHLVRFCDKNNLKLQNFKESLLIKFSEYLKFEGENFRADRSNNTVNAILKTTIYFFEFFGKEFLNNDKFCSNILKAEIQTVNLLIGEADNKVQHSGWYHRCFLPYDIKKSRSPISQQHINQLYEAVEEYSQSVYVKQRNLIVLHLLEYTGARAGEIALLKIEDIEKALKQTEPMLKMVTLKTKQESFRLVPIHPVTLNKLKTFIKIYRSKVVRKTIGKNNDHGYLLINEKTGKPIVAGTISNEISNLRKIAKIEEQVCAHMFRHRFITNFFVKLIKQYDWDNQTEFKNALLDINSLKVHIQQVTGHRNVDSLNNYIDLAKAELTNMDSIIKKVNNATNLELVEKERSKLLDDLEKGKIKNEEYIKRIRDIKI